MNSHAVVQGRYLGTRRIKQQRSRGLGLLDIGLSMAMAVLLLVGMLMFYQNAAKKSEIQVKKQDIMFISN